LNSNANFDTDIEHNGFQGTVGTKNKASYGVRLFLNICASYLLSKKGNEGEGKLTFHYHYPEPFGIFTESFGTEEFPRFDFQCPSIIRQNNAYDCGLAVVANSMGFVNHLKSVKFRKTHMKRKEIRAPNHSKEVRFYLQEKIYSLRVFWDKVLADSHQQRYPGEIRRAEDLLKFMRAEYIEILDEIAGASVTDEISFRTLQEKIKQPTLPNTANTLKSNENESTMSPAPDVHVSTKILNQFLDELEQQQTPHVRCCDECNLSFEDGKRTQNERVDKRNVFQIPSIEAITDYIGHTPTSL
jgi:hypothetical protein